MAKQKDNHPKTYLLAEERKAFRNKIYEVKIHAWRDFMSSVQDPWKGLMKILNYNKNKCNQNKTLCSINGVYANDLSSSLHLLGNQFYPEPMEYLSIHYQVESIVLNKLSNIVPGECISVSEYRKALKEMRKATAPGIDGITNNILNILSEKCEYEHQYIDLFNSCLKLGVFPKAWKQASIILIPKAFSFPDSEKALRPISLTSVMSKLLEKIVLARILHYVELSGKMSLSQHAYALSQRR